MASENKKMESGIVKTEKDQKHKKKQQSEKNKLRLVFGDVTLGVHGKNFDYIFSYQTGGPESLVTSGMEWLYRTPKPTFWRATTDNDRGNKFPYASSMWLGADLFIWCREIKVKADGKSVKDILAPANNSFGGEKEAEEVSIKFRYETTTTPSTRVDVKYTVTADGVIRVDVHYHGQKGLPELPVFGMRFIMPSHALGYDYKGLSGETYPDRMAGGIKGYYTVEGLHVTPYLVPQDCGVHMETDYAIIYRDLMLKNTKQDGKTYGLKFESCGRHKFAFSCLPYTAEELENATHQEELPPARRTVMSVLGAVRGVGGIDSWGADVEKTYHIDASQDIKYAFTISEVQKGNRE